MFYVDWIHGTQQAEQVYTLRHQVFVDEQGYPAETERDNFDIMAWHCLIKVEDKPVATGRVYIDGDHFVVGRICVDKEARGQGFGDAVTRLLLDRALQAGAEEIWISAQTYVLPLYEKFGFVAYGEEYFEDNVPRAHRAMKGKREEIVFPHACDGACSDSV